MSDQHTPPVTGAGLDPSRVAEIVVTRDGRAGGRGSGYLVSAGQVLTAAHVIQHAATVQVRFNPDQPGQAEPAVHGQKVLPGTDLAIIGIDPGGLPEPLREPAPVAWGRVSDRTSAVIPATTAGYPLFKLRHRTDGSSYRDLEVATGSIPVAANRREGTLALYVTAPPPAAIHPDEDGAPRSPWEGISGAPVFSTDHLIGVITRHDLAEGPGRLVIERATHPDPSGRTITALTTPASTDSAGGWSSFTEVMPPPTGQVVAGAARRDAAETSLAATRRGVVLGLPVAIWDPEDLGVHPTFAWPGETGLTPYVIREHDERLRADLSSRAEADAASAMVIGVGTSCSGKTRTLFEAIRATVPTWRLVAPNDAAAVDSLLRQGVPRNTVVWLDELQRHLTVTPEGVRVASGIRRLLEVKDTGPILFAATIWPTNLLALRERPSPERAAAGGSAITDLLADRRVVVVEVPDSFAAGHAREALAARDDPRLAAALQTATGGRVTQVLAGGAQLVTRLESPSTGAGPTEGFNAGERAVILAACDLRRVGLPNPVPDWALQGAAPGYLDRSAREALDPNTWFRTALGRILRDADRDNEAGGTPTLDIAGRGVPALATRWTYPRDGEKPERCYLVHDYLVEHRLRAHGHEPTATSLWDTLAAGAGQGRQRPTRKRRRRGRHRLAPGYATSAGLDALARGLLDEAIDLLEVGTANGDITAATARASAVELRDGLPGLLARARDGDILASDRAVPILARLGDVAGLRELTTLPNTGYPREALDGLLARRGDLDELRRRVADGDQYARAKLGQLVFESSDREELLARAQAGDREAEDALIFGHDRLDEIRGLARSGLPGLALAAACMLANEGWFDELADWAASGSPEAAEVQEVVQRRGTPEWFAELDERASAGDPLAQESVAAHLAARGDLDGLRARAAARQPAAQRALVTALGAAATDEATTELRGCVHATYAGAAVTLLQRYRALYPIDLISGLDTDANPRRGPAGSA